MKKKLLFITGLLAVFGLIVSAQASGTVSKWSKELVILADTGSGQKGLEGVLVGKQVATENPQVLMTPYCFTVGSVAFLATVDLKSDGTKSRPSVVTPFGLAPYDSSVNCETSFSAVVSPTGERYIVWNEIETRREWDDAQAEWITKSYAQIKISTLLDERFGDPEWKSGSLVVSRETGNAQNQFRNLEVLFTAGRLFISAEWSQANSSQTQILLADSTDFENWAERVTFVSPGDSNDFLYKSSFFTGSPENVFMTWNETNSTTDPESLESKSFLKHWSLGGWGETVEIEDFPYVAGLSRSADIVSFWNFDTQTRKLRVIDYQISARAFQFPVFEASLPSNQIAPEPPGPSLYSNGVDDTITVLWQSDTGVVLSVISQTNTFAKIPGSNDERGLVNYGFLTAFFSPGGKPAIFNDDRIYFFDSGKWVEEPLPTETRGYRAIDWFNDGNLSVIKMESGEENFSGIVSQTLKKDDFPKLESPSKVVGSAKVGQTLTVGQPSWASYSKITSRPAVSWLSCSKSVAKQVATVPSNCSPIRNSSGLAYRLAAADKGKYITAKFVATNSLGTGTTILPSLGPVK